MANENTITSYKNRVIRDILHNADDSLSTEIVMAINPDYVGCEDELIYRNIFPYLKIPDVQTMKESYITMAVNMPKVSTKNYFFKDMLITINVLVHEDCMKMDDGYSSTRADYMGERINRIFNQNRNYGTVALEVVSDEESIVLNKYFMRSMRFRCNEMNTVRC